MADLRDIAIVAGHELGEALRSRRVLVLALLYLGGAVAGTLVFVDILASLEAGLADAVGGAAGSRPGAMTRELMRSQEFINMLSRLLRDRGLAQELAGLPPLALFYGWLALSFSPVLVMLTTTEVISTELSTGAIRFSLLRTSRLRYSLGKLVGQTLLMALSVLAGAVGVWVAGWFALADFAGWRTALWLGLLCPRVWCYGFAHVGLALGLSHLTRSVPGARALGLVALAALGMLWGLSNSEFVAQRPTFGVLVQTLAVVLPRSHLLTLWRPELLDRLPALAVLIALGVVFFALGYRHRARRDA